ncbi:alpha/beta hydrolase [Xanthomonas oryzae]|nr:alpha/beta hydrolase [Xanthomonas oryzae]
MMALAITFLPNLSRAEPSRGTVLQSSVMARFSAKTIAAMHAAGSNAVEPNCDVRVVELTYSTVGVNGEPATASAALLVPSGKRCQGPYPLLAWGHATETRRDAEQAKIISNDRTDNPLVTEFASNGYVVVSTDYIGLGKSNYTFHPYLHAATEASAIVDSLRASRNFLRQENIPLSGRVMLSGNSQGAHAAMAAQREIETRLTHEFNLVASAPISGPYALSQSFLDSWSGRNAVGESTFGVMLASYAIVGMQRAYKNIYVAPDQVFQPPWAAKIESNFPGKSDSTELVASLPSVDQVTHYFQPWFYKDFVNNPNNAFRRDLVRNDLLDWIPRTPTLLCGSNNDATVPLKNAQTAIASFRQHGSYVVNVMDLGTGNPADNSAFAHLTTMRPCMNAVRVDLLDKRR